MKVKMLVKTYCGAIKGIGAVRITIEVFITQGIRFFIVGLADSAIRESQQRIESALINTGFQWPRFRMVINLSPAHLRKGGSHFDLALATGILAASRQLPGEKWKDFLLLGELSLDGRLMPVRGVLSMALLARNEGLRGIVVPAENLAEARVVEGIICIGAESLSAVVAFMKDAKKVTPDGMLEGSGGNDRNAGRGGGQLSYVVGDPNRDLAGFAGDFSDVMGQEGLKRAMTIAAAGRHNMLMVGAPGSGKSMMARRIPGILPPMTLEESLEATQVHSIAGLLGEQGLLRQRPFRSPHHTSSAVAISGGGGSPRPGELSLAHHGVLFLDELPEFRREVLEVLRQPIEEGVVHISRAAYQVSYPTDFLLLAAMNPCPCGYYNHPGKECQCSSGSIRHYLSRISGPLLDRIDLQLEVVPLAFEQLQDHQRGTGSDDMKKEVLRALNFRQKRLRESGSKQLNGRMGPLQRRLFCRLDAAGSSLLRSAMDKLSLSARAHDRILNVARTVADMEASEEIRAAHVAEAITYRSLDRENWAG